MRVGDRYGSDIGMILILGGAFQGKLSYALELTGYRREDFADGADCSWDAVFSARGIYHFEVVAKMIEMRKKNSRK